jgi:hypothetical protein
MLSVTLTRHPVSTLTPASAVPALDRPMKLSPMRSLTSAVRPLTVLSGLVVAILVWFASRAIVYFPPPPRVTNYDSSLLRPFLSADVVCLYSLDPTDRSSPGTIDHPSSEDPFIPRFHEWLVLGDTLIRDTLPLRQSLEEIDRAYERSTIEFACFQPRHALRIETAGHTHDLVICYECASAQIFVDASLKAGFSFAVEAELPPSPTRMNSLLDAQGVTLAEPRKSQ